MSSKNEWHRSPTTEGRCPICACPRYFADRLHRATLIEEGYTRRWLKKTLTTEEGEQEIGASWKRTLRRRATGPTFKTQETIVNAAIKVASGSTMKQAAKAVGTSYHFLNECKFKYRDLWTTAYDEAVKQNIQKVVQRAGTDQVFDPAYLPMAENCERWSSQRGENIFPTDGKPTLGTFYEDYFKPICLSGASRRTIEQYDGRVRQWKVITGDPPLVETDTTMLAKFRDVIAQQPAVNRLGKVSPNTVRSKLRNIQAILDKAAQPCRGNRDAAGIIDQAPYVRAPRQLLRPVRIVTVQQVDAVYRAAFAADLPKVEGIKPPVWWRALLVVAYNTGLRRRALFELRRNDIDWKHSQLNVSPFAMKTSIGQQFPLGRVVMDHLRTIGRDHDLLFPFPHDFHAFYRQLSALQDVAGLGKSERFTLKQLRSTAASLLWNHSPQAAQVLLGHTSLRTTRNHYINGQAILSDALRSMPQPQAFTEQKKHA